MPFWKNERYATIETACKEGDPIRGLPRRDFPWEILSETKKDAAGDAWHIRIQCLGIEPENIGTRVVVTLEAWAGCQISQEGLRALGYDPTRLAWMGVETDSAFEKTLRSTFRISLKDLEKVAKLLRDRFVETLFAKTNEEAKRAAVREKVAQHSLSGFDRQFGAREDVPPQRSSRA